MQLSRLSLSFFWSPHRCRVGAPGNVVNGLSRAWSSRGEHRRIREDDFIRAPTLALAFLEFPWQVAARIIMRMTKMIPIMVSPFYYFIVSNASLRYSVDILIVDSMNSFTRDAGFIIVIGSGSGSRWRKRSLLRFEKLFGFLSMFDPWCFLSWEFFLYILL